jgi:hypothetical protein
MSNPRTKLKIVGHPSSSLRPQSLGTIAQGTVVAIRPDGLIDVLGLWGHPVACAWLEGSGSIGIVLCPGDVVLVSQQAEDTPPVVLGRVGRYGQPAARIELQAGQALSLKCGDASMELRADGKVLIRGEDVLVRAKGTKRIRAGAVSIN